MMIASVDVIHAKFKVDRVNFSLDVDIKMPGLGITVLFGPSGSGKTTLLRCIAGLEHVRNGYLNVGGEIWQDGGYFLGSHKRPLGYVFQEASLFPHLTVLGNLLYGMKRAKQSNQAQLGELVQLLNIKNLLERRVEVLSGGERQRVAIARALALSPRLLLMDEPLSSLDFRLKHEIILYLEELHQHLQIPVLYVTHSLDEAARLADHLVLLDKGREIAAGIPQQVLSFI